MRSDTTQQPLPLAVRPTPEEWRASAETALRNPFETPARCRERHDYYLAQAELCEREGRG